MPVNWNEQAYLDHYRIKIGWSDAADPANITGERIVCPIRYGKDFARYAERGPVAYWFFVKRAAVLINRLETLGLLSSHRVIIVGCGFGYLVYCFRHASLHPQISDDYPNTYGIDLSSYVSANWDSQRLGDEDYVNDDWEENNLARVRSKLMAMIGGFDTFHVVISFIIESYNPVTESLALNRMFTACERGLVGSDYRRIIHVVDNALQRKTLDDGSIVVETGEESHYQTLRDYDTTLLAHW